MLQSLLIEVSGQACVVRMVYQDIWFEPLKTKSYTSEEVSTGNDVA